MTTVDSARSTPSRFAKFETPWWFQPAITALVLGGFVVYATFRVFENRGGEFLNYVSPFYAPDLTFLLPIGLHGVISPAFLILPAPLSLRLTCYYYRKAYYRSFVADPIACAKGDAREGNKYRGETKFPLVLQNLHRYAIYLGIVVLVFLWYDAILAFHFADGWHVQAGSLLFLLNVTLLSGYTLGCHSLRHLVGGKLDCYSCDLAAAGRYGLWSRITMLNNRHQLWAWCSLFSVCAVDIFVRFLAPAGLDLRLI
ncbi:MAG: succinate dehydrogenase [Thermoplasmatota archaeon]